MKLGIVGGGGASVALLAALTRTNIPPIHITLFEPEKAVGPGRAYLLDSDTALLNVTAERMSLLPDTTGDFLSWLRATRAFGAATANITDGDYLPRRLFGAYLEHFIAQTGARLKQNGQELRIVNSTVARISRGYKVTNIETEDRQCFSGFDRVVLCVGVGGSTDIHGLLGQRGYVNDPYPLRNQLGPIEPQSNVLVMGTGLTAVDVVLFLLQAGHKGQITMASRNGLLPSVRTNASAPALQFLSKAEIGKHLTADPVLSLERLFGLFEDELAVAGLTLNQVCREARPGENFRTRLKRQLREAGLGGARWQPIMIRAMHESTEVIWHALPERDRRRFLTEWHTRFISLLSPIPQTTAAKLKAAADGGQLIVGRCPADHGLERETSGGFRARLEDRTVTADVVVNTIRPANAAIPERAVALVADLVKSGEARLHPFGGVEINAENNRLLDAHGRENRGVFALGQLTAGTHYFTSSMLKISQQAKVIADQLLADARAVPQAEYYY